MTVTELIERLHAYDGNLSVYREDDEFPPTEITDVGLDSIQGEDRVMLA